jgi:hypothetical protein
MYLLGFRRTQDFTAWPTHNMLGSLLAEGQDAAADQKFWDTLFNIIGIILALLGNVGGMSTSRNKF